MARMQYRNEEDSIGSKKVNANAYYGVQSLRAAENFPITGETLNKQFIISLAEIKKACAEVNNSVGLLDTKKANAIKKACDEIIKGKLHDQFIVDPIQGSAGTSMNMNANEVIANRAIELLGGEKGDYTIIHPNDHVNYGQSTNDVIPSAGKMTILKLWKSCEKTLLRLVEAFNEKAEEYDGTIKMGRTQMQDAVPIRLGQEFSAYAVAVKRGIDRINSVMSEMKELNMGGTAVGTGLNADATYYKEIVPAIARISGYDLVQATDLIDGTQNLDSFAAVSAAFKALAVALSKICNDLRLMSSGPRCGFEEINLPAKQNGSSIMPGKVNPVIPEVLNQVCFNIIGNDVTVAMAAEGGQLELNAFEPIIYYCLFQSIETLDHAVHTFTVNCVEGITANEKRCKDLVDNSVGIVTAICPHVGYKKAASVAKKAIRKNASVRDMIIKDELLTKNELDMILEPMGMTTPGIAAEELLIRKGKKPAKKVTAQKTHEGKIMNNR
ncbi:MAG: aspartate ammonia-lyase [Lachnospiraceae bacterium]|nr:aspartate ammonia-lyase [Lachnospiraceae bacterium]